MHSTQAAKFGQNLGLGHAGRHDLDSKTGMRGNRPDLDLVSALHVVWCEFGVTNHPK